MVLQTQQRGRAAAPSATNNTRARSLKVSLSAREAGEGRSVTIELDNPDEMIDKVVDVLSARFPVDAFFDAVSSNDESINNSQPTPMITSLEQALERPDEVSKILPAELQQAWLQYVATYRAAHNENNPRMEDSFSNENEISSAQLSSSSYPDQLLMDAHQQPSVDHHQHPLIHHQHPVVQQQQHSVVYHPTPAVHHQASVVHQQAPVVHQQAPVVHHQAPVVHHQPPIIHQQPPVVYHQPAVVHQQPPVVQKQPPVVYQQSPIIHHVAPVVLQQEALSHHETPELPAVSQQQAATHAVVAPAQSPLAQWHHQQQQGSHFVAQADQSVHRNTQSETSDTLQHQMESSALQSQEFRQETQPSSARDNVSETRQAPSDNAESGVFNDEGKWEVWNDTLEDAETEHSKSGSLASHMDDSSFHDSQAAGPIATRIVNTSTSEHVIVGGHTQMAETLAAQGVLAELIGLPENVSSNDPALLRIAQRSNFDAESLRVMVSLFRSHPDFHAWCSSLINSHVQMATVDQENLSGVAASAFLAGTSQPQTANHHVVGPAGQQYHVQRQVAGASQQSLEVSNAAMTVQTTVTVNPRLMEGHVAHTTTTLMKREGHQKTTVDHRPVGTVSVSSPVATPSAYDYTVGASPITAQTVASPSLLRPSAIHVTPKADVTPMGGDADVMTEHHQTMMQSTTTHTAAVVETDRQSVASGSPHNMMGQSPLARAAVQNAQSHIVIDHDKLAPQLEIVHQHSPVGTSTRSSHSGAQPVRSLETRIAIDVGRVRDRLYEAIGVSTYRYPLSTQHLFSNESTVEAYLKDPEYSSVFEAVVTYTYRTAENLFGELFDSFGLPTASRSKIEISLPRVAVTDDVSTLIDVLKEVTIINVIGSMMKYVRDNLTPELNHTFSYFVSHLNSIIFESTNRVNLQSTGVVSQYVQMLMSSSSHQMLIRYHNSPSLVPGVDPSSVSNALIHQRLGVSAEQHQNTQTAVPTYHPPEVHVQDLLASHVTRTRLGAEEDKRVTTVESNVRVVSSGAEESRVEITGKGLDKVSVSSQSADASVPTHHTVEVHDLHRELPVDRVTALTTPPPGVQVIRTIVHPVGYRPGDKHSHPAAEITTTTTYTAPGAPREIIYLQPSMTQTTTTYTASHHPSTIITSPQFLATSPLAAPVGRHVITPLTVLPRSDLGTAAHMAQAMTTPASFVRSQSPLARNIGHERLFEGHSTTTVQQTAKGLETEVVKPSSYLEYNEWKARAGVDVNVVRGDMMKSSSTIKVGDLQVTAPGAPLTPVANVMPLSQHFHMTTVSSSPPPVTSPLAQLRKENPNAILSHLAQHWTSQSVEREESASVSTHTK